MYAASRINCAYSTCVTDPWNHLEILPNPGTMAVSISVTPIITGDHSKYNIATILTTMF